MRRSLASRPSTRRIHFACSKGLSVRVSVVLSTARKSPNAAWVIGSPVRSRTCSSVNRVIRRPICRSAASYSWVIARVARRMFAQAQGRDESANALSVMVVCICSQQRSVKRFWGTIIRLYRLSLTTTTCIYIYMSSVWILAAVVLIALPLISYVVEWLRRAPVPPERLSWAPDIPIRQITVGATRLRYITAGQGPPLVLLHTLRTQLDMFQRVVSVLAKQFRVYALDYPGHGYSDIPKAEYTSELFVSSVAGFLDALELRDAVVVGESIGGSIALILAARHHPSVRRVVAVNPYDYDGGRGIRRSSILANLLFGINNVPILGSTFTRLRAYPIVKRIFDGGVYRRSSMPPALAREMYTVGNRPGHYRAFMSLVRHWAGWERARSEYKSIERPVLLVYGDHDWSRVAEREADRQAIPGAQVLVVKDAGHFLALDAPDELIRAVVDVTKGGI